MSNETGIALEAVPVFYLKEPGTLAGKSFALSVLFRRMCFIMALQVAPAVGYAGVFEFQSPGCSVRPNNGRIEINQVAVVQPCALNGTDAVSIVTCRARNLLLQVFGVLCETFIVQDAVSAVTSIAKLIRITALLCIIGRVVSICEKIGIIGAVGAFSA